MGWVAIANIPADPAQPDVFIFAAGQAVPDSYVTEMGIQSLVVDDPNSDSIGHTTSTPCHRPVSKDDSVTYFIALQNVELPPGSGVNAYATGARIPGDVVERLGIRDLVRPVAGDKPPPKRTASHGDKASASDELKPKTE